MKKYILSLLIITCLFPNKSFSQNNDEIAGAAVAGAVVGAVVGAIKINQIEEMLEQIG